MAKKPEIGMYVRVHQTNAYGEDHIFFGRVYVLLSKMFVVHQEGRDYPSYVFYTDEWRESNEDLL